MSTLDNRHQFTIMYLDHQGRQVWPSTADAKHYTQAGRCIHCGATNSGDPCTRDRQAA